MSSSVAYPVQVLREHITALEAAISVCLADPGHRPVHKLRTETRRVEALLSLLALVPGLPEHHKESAKLLRALRKLRRAAGTVRDLDVHRKLLESFAEEHGAGVKPATDQESAQPVDDAPGSNGEVLTDSAEELRKQMGHKRDKAAAALQELLQERQARTSRAAEALLKALKSAADLALPGANLLRDAEAVLMRDRLLDPGKIEQLTEDELHSVRKSAKAARYVAESLPEDPALVAAAEHFESLQEAGGQWHDALELARAARHHFGKAHELTAAYREDRDGKLQAYRTALTAQARSKTGAAQGKTSPPRKAGGRKTATA